MSFQLAALCLLLGAVETTQRPEIPLHAGERVVLTEINGPVEITASKDSIIRVEFVRIGESSPLPAGSLEVEHLSEAVRLSSADFRRYPEGVRNRLRIELPENTRLDVSAVRGELVVDAPLEEVRAVDIRGALRIQQAGSVEAIDIGGSVAIVGASTVELRNVRGSASVVTDQDGAVIFRNIDGAVQVREKP